MRLIDAEHGLISAIQKATGCNFLTASSIVDNRPTVTPQWIPVSEKIPDPERSEDVLAIDNCGEVMAAYTWDDCGDVKWYAHGNYDVPIKGWMPMPKLPEEN